MSRARQRDVAAVRLSEPSVLPSKRFKESAVAWTRSPGVAAHTIHRPMADFREELAAHLKGFSAAPFLFVGAGISRRYLGLDDWDELLQRLATIAGKDYAYYVASADGDRPTIASKIAEDLHEAWWSDKRFGATREKYEGMLKTKESALKAEASEYLADSIENLPKKGPGADELQLLRRAVVDGIITTNFDPLLEELFPEFRVFVGQEELLFEDAHGVGEIYKIHGSHEQPDSLVLTRRDYDRFHETNPYLAAKLMTIFVEHPMVFLGYSLGDQNVAAILQAIVSCLKTPDRIAKLADRLIFIVWDETVKEPTMAPTVIPVEGNPIPVLTLRVPDFLSVFEVMSSQKRRFPAKLLRQLKEQVYDLVLEKEPEDRLFVQDLDPRQDPREVDVVFGVGAVGRLTAYAGLTRSDLIADVLEDGKKYDALRVVQEALPAILSHPGNVPIYKCLREANLLDDRGNLLTPNSVPEKVRKHLEARTSRLGVIPSSKAWVAGMLRNSPTLDDLIASEKPHEVLWCVPGLDEDNIDSGKLREFLKDQSAYQADASHGSQWVKLVCLYDWLAHGRPAKVARATNSTARTRRRRTRTRPKK
jgi:hypothetical protein